MSCGRAAGPGACAMAGRTRLPGCLAPARIPICTSPTRVGVTRLMQGGRPRASWASAPNVTHRRCPGPPMQPMATAPQADLYRRDVRGSGAAPQDVMAAAIPAHRRRSAPRSGQEPRRAAEGEAALPGRRLNAAGGRAAGGGELQRAAGTQHQGHPQQAHTRALATLRVCAP